MFIRFFPFLFLEWTVAKVDVLLYRHPWHAVLFESKAELLCNVIDTRNASNQYGVIYTNINYDKSVMYQLCHIGSGSCC